MSIKQRRENEKLEMRKKIMKAAVEIIEKDGYEQLSIRKIASKIQYSPTTIYIYYEDKAKIISDMSEKLYAKVFDEVSMTLKENAEESVKRQVEDSMKVLIKCLCSEAEMAKAIMFSGQNVIYANDCHDGKPNNQGIAMLNLLFLEGINQGVFRESIKDNSWMIISSLFGFISGVITNKLHERNDFQNLTEDFVQILLGGILNEQGK